MRERLFAILCALNLAMCTMDFGSFEFSNQLAGQGGSGATSGTGANTGTGAQGGMLFGECQDASDCTGTATDCATPVCNAGQCGTDFASVGDPCNDDGGQVCAPDGSCVECVQDGDCAGAATCENFVCEGFACDDTVQNGNETDVDCGGDTCDACADGQMCMAASDCLSGFCDGNNTCAACATTADCAGTPMTWCDGGVCNPLLADGEICALAESCLSGFCADGLCCDTACSGTCEACTAALTGGMDGVCGFIPLFEDPEMECMSGEHCQGDGTCGTCGLGLTPVGGMCPAECTGGCMNGICTIDCNAGQACKNMTITCPVGFDCDVQCGGNQGCNGAAIACPADHECNVDCAGAQSCKSATVTCSTNGPCAMDCSAMNQACQGAVLDCGDNLCEATCEAGTMDLPTVNCGNSCSCSSC